MAETILTGEESTVAVARVAVAMFNRFIAPGDLIVYRHDNGTSSTGSKLTKAAWIDEDGWIVCEIEGYPDPVCAHRITPFKSPSTPTRKRNKAALFQA